MAERLVSGKLREEDITLDTSLRPKRLEDFVGQVREAATFYQRALNGNLSEKVGLSTRRRLASKHKKNEEWDKAVALWKEMADSEIPSSDLLYSLRELSMYCEHRAKEYPEARKYAEEGYVLSMNFSSHYENDFTHRMERLKRKIKGSKDK